MEELFPSLAEVYDIKDTAAYILERGYKRVALQFPDQLLKFSVVLSTALQNELNIQNQEIDSVKLYVLADTTYGSCCGDEIAAAHVNAQCIIHYGHTCLSQMSKLPMWYAFGRAALDVEDCVQQLVEFQSVCKQATLVLFDLEYSYAIPQIKTLHGSKPQALNHMVDISFAEIPDRAMDPQVTAHHTKDGKDLMDQCLRPEQETCHRETAAHFPNSHFAATQEIVGANTIHFCKQEQDCETVRTAATTNVHVMNRDRILQHGVGDLRWNLWAHDMMEDMAVVWIGMEGPALTNFMLTHNGTTVARYDPDRKVLFTDVATQSNFLKRRYYLVERAKDANIVGIVIGTLGVAGYLEVVSEIKKLVKEAGKKSYTLAMGKPSPTKLANFPECDIFVLVACAQTAVLDSKDFMAPVITPFEAVMAWKRGSQWNGDYCLDFTSLRELSDINKNPNGKVHGSVQIPEYEEARFSFIKGGYVEDHLPEKPEENEGISSRGLVLSRQAQKALQLQDKGSDSPRRTEAKSSIEFFSSRMYHGLKVDSHDTPIQHHMRGRKGRALSYDDEQIKDAALQKY